MFDDGRSKSVVFVAHCVLNQNAVSDGTASSSGSLREILDSLCSYGVGVVQMPCPELHCLGLDRGNVEGGSSPVVEENTRIREMLGRSSAARIIRRLALQVVFQIMQYIKHGFEVKGILGINRSPSCGVDTTSRDNKEVAGRGVFIEALSEELKSNNVSVEIVGIKAFESQKAVATVKRLIGIK